MRETTFYEGQEFSSFDELKTTLKKYEAEHKCLFIFKRNDKCEGDDVLKYSNITYVCKQYGDPRSNPGVLGIRPKQSTYKTGCEVMIKLSRSKKLRKLVVKELHLEHDHPCNDVVVKGYPQNRKLSKEGVEKTNNFLEAKVIPSIIRPLLREREEDSGKIILGRDISNVRTKKKLLERNGRSDEEMLQAKIDEIKLKDPGAHCKIQYDPDSKQVDFILLQTSAMREALHRYPEVILMDITYKINKNRMPVCVIEVMDGEGLGQEVCYAFLANEQKSTLSAVFMEFFKCSGKEVFSKTQCVVVDKDFSEIGALREHLPPGVVIHICSVHTEKNFKLLVKGEPQKKELMESLKAMIYSEDKVQFDANYANFEKNASPDCKDKFVKNWLKCREAWSLKDRTLVMTLRNHSTNRVESLNQKLKLVFDIDTCLYEAVSGIVSIILKNKQDDQLYRQHVALTKRVYINKCSDPVIQIICNDLTDFASKIVCEQVLLSKKLGMSALTKYPATSETCSCELYKTLRMPCQHIMLVRENNGLPIYSKDLVLKRWLKSYQLESVNVPKGSTDEVVTVPKPRMPGGPVAKILGPRQKFLKVTPITQQINTLVSESGTKIFYRRLQVLLDIADSWSRGNEVMIVPVGSKEHPDNDLAEQEEQRVAGKNTEKTGTFKLTIVPVKGRTTGRSQTLFSSSKKTPQKSAKTALQKSENKAVKKKAGKSEITHHCIVCGRDGATLDCAVCRKPVHAYACSKIDGDSMMSLICATCQETTVNPTDNHSSRCCACNQEAGSHMCVKCNQVVHAIPPCSIDAPDSMEGFGQKRICSKCQNPETAQSQSSEEMLGADQGNDDDNEEVKPIISRNTATTVSETIVLLSDNSDDDWEIPSSEKPCSPTIDNFKPHSPEEGFLGADQGNDDDYEEVKPIIARNTPTTVSEIIVLSSEDSDEERETAYSKEHGAPFTLKTVKTKGRPKTLKTAKGKPTFTFRDLADEKVGQAKLNEREARKNRGADIPDKDVIFKGLGKWTVKSQTKGCLKNYSVSKNGELFSCTCLDLLKPCKHIYKIKLMIDKKQSEDEKSRPQSSKENSVGADSVKSLLEGRPPFKDPYCKGCHQLLEGRISTGKNNPKSAGRAYWRCYSQQTKTCSTVHRWEPNSSFSQRFSTNAAPLDRSVSPAASPSFNGIDDDIDPELMSLLCDIASEAEESFHSDNQSSPSCSQSTTRNIVTDNTSGSDSSGQVVGGDFDRRHVTIRRKKPMIRSVPGDSDTSDEDQVEARKEEPSLSEPFNSNEMEANCVLSSTVIENLESGGTTGTVILNVERSNPLGLADYCDSEDEEEGECPSPPKRLKAEEKCDAPRPKRHCKLPVRLASSYHLDSLTDSM